MKNIVIVYGTLKTGKSNHHVLKDSKLLGTFVTKDIDIHEGPFYPMAKLNHNGTGASYCEVYAVDDNTMRVLDILEGIDDRNGHRGLYRRVLIDSPYGDAWVYVYNHSTRGRIIYAW